MLEHEKTSGLNQVIWWIF